MTLVRREAIRRLALLVALPVGALLIVWSAPRLLSLSSVDWKMERGHEIAALLSEEARRDLNSYIANRTAGRVVTLPADPWQTFIGQARETLAGRPPTPAWKSATEWNEYRHEVRMVYLDPTAPLPEELLGVPGMVTGDAYLRLEGEDSTRPTLRLRHLEFGITHSGAPHYMIFPLRHAGWWVILGGVLIYALTPWSGPAANQFCPITPGMAFLTDLVGVMLYGTFVWIWSILILEPSIPGHGEWSQILVFTLVFGGMALSGVSILAVALWYITFRIQWDEEGLRSTTLSGETFHAWKDIEGISLQPVVYRFARRIRTVSLLLSVYNWRMAAPALLMQTESVCLHLSTRQGDGWQVDLGNLSPQGLADLVDEFRARGIPVSSEVAKLGAAVSEAKHPYRIWPIYLVIAVLVSLVVCALWRTMPPALD